MVAVEHRQDKNTTPTKALYAANHGPVGAYALARLRIGLDFVACRFVTNFKYVTNGKLS